MTLFLNLICISLPSVPICPVIGALRRNRNIIIIFKRCRRSIAPHFPVSPPGLAAIVVTGKREEEAAFFLFFFSPFLSRLERFEYRLRRSECLCVGNDLYKLQITHRVIEIYTAFSLVACLFSVAVRRGPRSFAAASDPAKWGAKGQAKRID